MVDMVKSVNQDTLPPPRMTFEEFLDWLDEDTWAEWVDGEVIVHSPAADDHQDIVGFLGSILRLWVEHSDLGIVLMAPFLVKMPKRGREPDLMVILKPNTIRLRDTYLDGPADLIVEILSPESAARDRGDKYFEYEAAGVPEYWLLNPMRQWAEIYQLGADGAYAPAFVGRSGVYHSAMLPGLWLRIEWLWQQPLPPVIDILKELKVI